MTVNVPALQWTEKQAEAARLLRGPEPNVLVYGGSQSGKTRLICEWIWRMCMFVPGLVALILRHRRQHAKDTVWHQTLLGQVMPRWGLVEDDVNKSDLMIPLPNGSEIWVGGTDDQVRIDKVLGRGAGIIYLNEASQISYDANTTVRTRLSQMLTYAPGTPRAGQVWIPKLVADCNPPAPTHWTHRLFIDHVEPKDGRALDPERYVAAKINPRDNVANLPAGYIEHLEELPAAQRARFLNGEWTKPEGAVFPVYSEDMLIDDAPECEKYVVGVDLVTYAAVLVGFQRYSHKGEIRWRIYCVDEWRQQGALAHEANTAIQRKWGEDYDFRTVIDHNLGEAGTREFAHSRLADKGQGSVEAGVVLMQNAMHHSDFFVCRRCGSLHYELENYHRDESGAIVKEDDHGIDGTRMAVFSTIRKRRELMVA